MHMLFHKQDSSRRLWRLLKLFRVPRLVELLNVNRVKRNIKDHYNKILIKAVEENRENETYPILLTILLVQMYKIFRLMMVILTSSYFLGILWHILVCDIQKTTYDENDEPLIPTFQTEKLGTYRTADLEDITPVKQLVKIIYFSLTTLSTIGFGDFSPVSPLERSVAAFILLFGVAMFSFIMGQFIEILLNYKELGQVG
jgi:hypothetical protein